MAKKKKTDIDFLFLRVKEDEEGSYVRVGPIEVKEKKGEKERVKFGPLNISDEGVRVEKSLNSKLEGIAWAAFFILIGCVWFAESVYHVELEGMIPLGVGIIWLSLNYAKSRLDIRPSSFTVFLGLAAVGIGIVDMFFEDTNAFAVIAIILGVYLIFQYGRKGP